MANTVRILITAKDEVSGQIDKIRDKAGLLSKTDIGKGMAMGAGIAGFNVLKGAALGALDGVKMFAEGSVAAASNQREALALTQQVFESSSDSVVAWSKNTKDAFSATEAMDFASKFGTAFKNVGMSLDETTTKAKEMTKLAGDLGSAFNTSSEEAAIALRSGLLGESEPLRRFGVFLDEAKTKATAMAMGMDIVGGKLTDVQKVTARYAQILTQTADSQGMFGRDTESLADKTKLLETSMTDLQAKLGTVLVPVLADAAAKLSDIAIAASNAGDAVSGMGIDLSFLTHNVITVFTEDLNPFKFWADRMAAAAAKGAEAWDTGSERIGASLKVVAGRTGRMADANSDAAKTFGAVRKRASDAADALDDLRKSVDATLDSLIEASLGPKELTLKLKDATVEGSTLADKLDTLEGKKPTAKVREDIRDTKLAIIENKEEVIRLQGRLVLLGKVSLKDHERKILSLRVGWGDANDELAAYLRNLARVPGVVVPSRSPHGGGGRNLVNDAGGYIPPYGSSVVGENRAELIHVGAAGARVSPSVPAGMAGMGGGSGPVVIQLNVDGREMARVVDRHLYYEAARAPQAG